MIVRLGKSRCLSWITANVDQCVHVEDCESLRARCLAQLSAECHALVEMANPPDSFEVYKTAISAAAISTQIKAIESRLGLRVRLQCLPLSAAV